MSIDEHTSRQLNNYLLTSFAAVGFKAKSGFGAGLGAGLGAEYIEWFGMNLGGGYVYHTGSFGRVDLHIATINWPSVYYTVLEANVLPIYGMAGVGGRLGWRKAFGKAEIRVGLRWGFAYWLGGTLDSDDEFDYDKWGDRKNAFWYGSDVTPHFQILGRFSHGTFGIGIDIPIYLGVFADYHSSNYYDYPPGEFTSGIHIYLRWSVF